MFLLFLLYTPLQSPGGGLCVWLTIYLCAQAVVIPQLSGKQEHISTPPELSRAVIAHPQSAEGASLFRSLGILMGPPTSINNSLPPLF